MDAVHFRDADGQTGDAALELSLSDLLPREILAILPPTTNEAISIPFSDLSSYLEAAESHSTNLSSFTSTSSAPKRFRKRKRTPSEELSDSREAEYVRQEEREQEKDGVIDGEWTARSRRRRKISEEEEGTGAGAVEVVERRRSARRVGGRASGPGS